MTTRWEVERAVMRTNIRPLARFLVLTLLAKTDNETAVIPPQYTPSLSTLVAATGLARSAVADHLKYLEDLGWVKRSTPAKRSKYDRTHYALFVGREDPARPSSPPPGPLDSSSPEDGLVREEDGSPPADSDSAVRTEDYSDVHPESSSPDSGQQTTSSDASASDPSSPPPGHASTTTTSSSTPTSSRRGVRGEPKEPKLGTRIPPDFHPTVEMIAWAKKNTPNVGMAETEAFVDWAKAKVGTGALKRDWLAAWRNWMRKAQKDFEAEQKRLAARRQPFQAPPSNAPDRVAPEEQCPDHRGQRKGSCRFCRAEQLGRKAG